MKTVKISISGTLKAIWYFVLATWVGWRLVGIKRVPHPTEYTLEMKPPLHPR